MPVTEQKEKALLVDISMAKNSAQAVSILESFMISSGAPASSESDKAPGGSSGKIVDINAGALLLTPKIISKMQQMLDAMGIRMETVYSTVPQTQQAALDEGFFVKEKPIGKQYASLETFVAKDDLKNVDLLAELARKARRFPEEINALQESPVAPAQPAKASQALKREPAQESKGAQDTLPTLYLKQTLRSGQVIRYDGHIVIIGDVHAGSEIVATGDIAVWGELRGIAHAGANGEYFAEIRAMRIEALQLRISDFIARRPDRIYYHKQPSAADNVIVAPELAKVADGEIKIFKEVVGK